MQVLLERVGIEEGHRVLDVGLRDAKELKAIATRVGPTGYLSGIDINLHTTEACVMSSPGRLCGMSRSIGATCWRSRLTIDRSM